VFRKLVALAVILSSSSTFAYEADFVTQEGTSSSSRATRTRVQMNYNPANPVDPIHAEIQAPPQHDTQTQPQVNKPMKGLAKAWVPWLALMFQGHDKKRTRVNELLTLKPAQKFLLRIDPRIKTVRDNGDDSIEPIRKGQFKVSILLFTQESFEKGELTADHLIAEFSGVVKTRFDGNVSEDVLLRIHDVAAVLSRSMAIVVIEPMGEVANRADTGVYYAQAGPLRANRVDLELRDLEDGSEDLPARLEQARIRANESLNGVQMLGVAQYKRIKSQQFINNRVLGSKQLGWSKKEIEIGKRLCLELIPADLTADPEELIPRLMGHKRNARSECLRNWGRFFHYETRDLVEAVRGVQYLPEFTNTRYLNLTRDLNHLVISRQEVNQNVNVGVYGDFGIHRGVNVGMAHLAGGAKISAGMNMLMMRARTKEKIFNAQIHEGQHFQVYVDGYSLDLQLRRCLIVQPKVEKVRGAYGCLEKTHRKKITEKYYLMNHQREGSPFTDNDDPTTSSFRLIVRGEEAYAEVEQMLTSKNDAFDLEKFIFSVGGNDVKRPLVPDLRVTQDFPGAIAKSVK
jgi:hypothetical protein